MTEEERDPDLPPEWFFDDDEYTPRHQAFDEGFTHACGMLARMIGAKEWEMGDGSESWTGDANKTLSNILEAANISDPETNAIARHSPEVTALVEAARALAEFIQLDTEIEPLIGSSVPTEHALCVMLTTLVPFKEVE